MLDYNGHTQFWLTCKFYCGLIFFMFEYITHIRQCFFFICNTQLKEKKNKQNGKKITNEQ